MYTTSHTHTRAVLTVLLRLDDGLVALFAPLGVGEDHLQADVGVGWQVSHHVSGGFGVHLQAVGFALVWGFVVVIADGDVEGVTAGDVVAQRLPVHGDKARLRLCDLQTLGGPHGLCDKR